MIRPNVPLRRQAPCEDCGDVLDIEAAGVAQYVDGWAINRDAGGANAIALRHPHPRWLCKFCIDRRRKGGTPSQGSLL